MTIRHLKIFIAVAETGKMSLAAQKLYLTQPTVSQAIRELEEHYETRLFDRLSRRLYITEPGQHLLKMAKAARSAMNASARKARILSASPYAETARTVAGSKSMSISLPTSGALLSRSGGIVAS